MAIEPGGERFRAAAKSLICVDGDLDRIGQRWRLLNARVVDVISAEDRPKGS